MKKTYKHMEKIDKGWSNDQKYRINQESQSYLLRVSSLKQQTRVQTMFEKMKRVHDLSIPICKPISYEIIEDEIHAIYQYIEGKDLRDVLQSFSKEELYRLGYEAGEHLKKIHNIDKEKESDHWASRFNQKIDHKIKLYKESNLNVAKSELFIEYLNNHRHLLLNRPQSFHHGDYHIGNFMIDHNKNLIIIDFEKFDHGDPWEEFNRIVWSAQESPEFASGMIDGYFNCDVPEMFWKLLLLYISNNTISSLTWGYALGDEQYQVMLNQMQEILDWYDDLNQIIPTWYIKKNR